MEAGSEFRAALERALEEAAADERIAPALCATKLRMRFEFTDLGLALNVAASDQTLEWIFGTADWQPKLTLAMTSEVANRYLLGQESLAIAIARGKVRVSGESRVALLYLPATRLLCEPYRRVVTSTFPVLAGT
jgi:hypothetical protein